MDVGNLSQVDSPAALQSVTVASDACECAKATLFRMELRVLPGGAPAFLLRRPGFSLRLAASALDGRRGTGID